MLKELALQKGWAGKTISRSETVERLNPIIREHIIINRSYDAVIKRMNDSEARSVLESVQKKARANVGKIAETIYSCGGVAFNGTQLNPDDFDLGSGAGAITKLQSLDEDLRDLLKGESKVEHQMRTRAILGVVLVSTEERLAALRSLSKQIQ